MLTMDDGVHEPIDAYSPTFMRPRRTLIVDALPYGDGVLCLALNKMGLLSIHSAPHSDPHTPFPHSETLPLKPMLFFSVISSSGVYDAAVVHPSVLA